MSRFKRFIHILACFTALAGGHAFSSTLSKDGLTVQLDDATGQVLKISDAKGKVIVADSTDRYVVGGKMSLESADTVLSKNVDPNQVTFACVNHDLGLKISKSYRLNRTVLEKTMRYESAAPETLPFKISSQTLLGEDAAKTAYYYIPTDDGSKVWTSPFIACTDVTVPMSWPVEGGAGAIYYFPGANQVFFQKSREINGGYAYDTIRLGTDAAIENKLVPHGAITALGQDFISAAHPVTLTIEYALLDGDCREYHKFELGRAPFTDYKDPKLPSWFAHTRMFMSDGLSGTGAGLMENREAIGADILSFLKLLKPDEYVMVFFNHWSTSGDYPYEGTFRYLTNGDKDWSQPVPVEKLRENIKWLKSLSPRIKVGGYVFLSPAKGTPPYDKPEWLIHDKNGNLFVGGDGIGETGLPDFTSGYADYSLNQLEHMITDTGFDWIHLDFGPYESVNWKPRHVTQNFEAARFYDRLAKIMDKHDAALVENGAPSASLWAHASYFEVSDTERWEKKDWKILAVPGYLTALYRTNRPGTWVNNCYGNQDVKGLRNAFIGMKAWIRNGLTWWRDIPHSLAHEKVTDELLQTKLADTIVHPSWWRFETKNLEAEALQRGSALIIPLLLHGDQSSEETISLKVADLKSQKGQCWFGFDQRLSFPKGLDVYQAVPWQAPYIELLGFNVDPSVGPEYKHRIKLDPLRNYYHILTQVPAWVYSYGGDRTSLLLPENHEVKIAGGFTAGSSGYDLQVDNANPTAQILAYCPSEWTGVEVAINGATAKPTLVDVLGKRCLLIDIGKGASKVRVSSSTAASISSLPQMAFANPQEDEWREAAARLFYTNLEYRAFAEDGRSCLALRPVSGTTSGQAMFPIWPSEPADGFSLCLKGTNSGGNLLVTVVAGQSWTYEIKDDFQGWKEFRIERGQMKAAGSDPKWSAVTGVTLTATPKVGEEMTIADVKLLPPNKAEQVAQEPIKQRIIAYKTTKPPVIDGHDNDSCWQNCPVITDFYDIGKTTVSDSKTRVRVCYDDQNLYFFFENIEPLEVLDPPVPKNSEIWCLDHVELFLDPYRDMVNWYQIIVGSSASVQHIRYSSAGRSTDWPDDFDIKTALNWKASWTCEFKIPFKTLGKTPKEGDVWGVNFARMDIARVWSTWANTPGLLDPAGFGELLFDGEIKSPAAKP